jgi:hypothetical protein
MKIIFQKYKNATHLLLLMVTLISISSFAQTTEDTTDWRFHDDLLNNLVGKWDLNGIVYGRADTEMLEAEWVLNHQYLRIHEKSKEDIPEINGPFETEFFIGFNRNSERYIVHEMNVCGNTVCEGFYYASRTGNEIKLEKKTDSLISSIQRFTWEPASGSWHIEIRLVRDIDGNLVNKGKEGESVVNLKALRRLL